MRDQLPKQLLELIRCRETIHHWSQLTFFLTNDPQHYDAKRPIPHPRVCRFLADVLFRQFRDSALTDPEVAQRLHYIACYAVEALEMACQQSPQLFQPIARKEFHWPMYVGPRRDLWPRVKRQLAVLQLGADCALNLSDDKKRSWSFETVETRIAFELWQLADRFRKGPHGFLDALVCAPKAELLREDVAKAKALPPLTRANSKQWWRVAEPWFEGQWGEKFENHPDFQHYWSQDAYKEPVPGSNGRKKRLTPNARALIRRDIKAKIKQGFRTIACRAGV